jgi:magnesium chelatase family protein
MLATITSAALQGIDAEAVYVEVNTGEVGEPRLFLVGLPDTAVKESGDRVWAALNNTGFRPPRTRTTINLAPGHLRKEGPCYDLPIALGILAATGQLKAQKLDDWLIAGELSLSGATRPVRGALAMARLAKKIGKRGLLLPAGSAEEAALVEGVAVVRVESLDRAARFLSGEIQLATLDPAAAQKRAQTPPADGAADFSEIKGQHALRRAVEVAVSGSHNLLMIGPPARENPWSRNASRPSCPRPRSTSSSRFSASTPPPAAPSAVRRPGARGRFARRTTRCPMSHCSAAARFRDRAKSRSPTTACSSSTSCPSSNARHSKSSASRSKTAMSPSSRSAGKITLPCAFMLVAAMNPCKCGYLGDPKHECRCSPTEIQRYRARISGPLLDRIDIHIEAPALSLTELRNEKPGEASEPLRERVQAARLRQHARFAGTKITSNARMTHAQIRKHCTIDSTLGDLSIAAGDGAAQPFRPCLRSHSQSRTHHCRPRDR